MKEKNETRNVSIDRFRGLLIFSMIFFQLLEYFKKLGIFATISSHAPDSFIKSSEQIMQGFKGIFILPNLTIADLIAPAFIFTIGLTMVGSYTRKCKKYGKREALIMMLKRYLVFIGIGTMMSSINVLIDGDMSNGFFDLVDVIIFGLTVAVVLLGIIWVIFKKKKVAKTLAKLIQGIVILLGMAGIAITFVNTLMVVLGISEINFGYWLVLQHIGLSGIIALLIMSLSKENTTSYRLIMGLLIIAIFTLFHETTLPSLHNYNSVLNNMNVIDNTADGGFIGAIAYSGLLLIFTAIADVYHKDKKKFRAISLLLAIPAVVIVLYAISTFKPWDGSNNLLTAGLSKHLSINKGSISPSYLVVSLFACSFAFMIVDLFSSLKIKFDFLAAWGRNPIIMYILEFAFVGGLTAALEGQMETAPIYVAIPEALIIISILTFVAYSLYKKDKIIKI